VNFRELLASECRPFVQLPEAVLAVLEEHYWLLLRWNRKINLTRIVNLEDAVRFHYGESLFLGVNLPAGLRRAVDLGSGAGFPGLPIAVLLPSVEVVLLERDHRKAAFLKEATRSIPNVRVVAQVEGFNEQFDVVVSRAVAVDEVLRSSLGNRFALLVGQSDAHMLQRQGWRCLPCPWGHARFLALSFT
jgi:16S rRNA (guanine(527)-N(7))-methyltransferase RsmG